MRSDEIKRIRYIIRRDEISDETGWDLMGSDEISAVGKASIQYQSKPGADGETEPRAVAGGAAASFVAALLETSAHIV